VARVAPGTGTSVKVLRDGKEMTLAITVGEMKDTEVAASDDEGALDVTVKVENGVHVATVELRDGLRYQDAETVDLTYELPDGDDPRLPAALTSIELCAP